MFKQEGDFEKLCLKLNYQFHNKELLAQAITTKSAWRNNLQKAVIGHHEEMAFFGDGILRMVVDKILMEEFPYYKVGSLSKVRDLLVKNANLSEAAKGLALEQFILMDHNQVRKCQQGYPKLLADTIEAIIYAIYKDSGENLQEVKKFILSHSGISNTLISHRQEEEKLHMPIIHAIDSNDFGAVKKMLEEGFPVNFLFIHIKEKSFPANFLFKQIKHEPVQDKFDSSPIMNKRYLTPLDYALDCLEKIAVAKSNSKTILSIIEILLKFGANPNLHAKDNSALIRQLFLPRSLDGGITDTSTIKSIQEYSNTVDTKVLLDDVDRMMEENLIPNWEKLTDQVVEMLCRFGVKLDEENYSHENTLLELAIIHKQKYKIELLFKYKINPNSQNLQGKTPLHSATLFADNVLITKLLNMGADPTIVDKNGLKPFDISPNPDLKIILLKAEINHGLPNTLKEINIQQTNSKAVGHYQKWLKEQLPEELTQAIQLFTQVLRCKLYKGDFQDKNLVTDFYNLGSSYFQRRNYEKAKPLLERAYFLYRINEQQFKPKTDKYLKRLTECEAFIKQNKLPEYTTITVPTKPKTIAPIPDDKQLNYDQLNDILFVDLTQNYDFDKMKSLPTRRANPDAITLPAKPKTVAPIPNNKQLNHDQLDIELFSATENYHFDKVKNLLSRGANPDAISQTYGIILHFAIQTYSQIASLTEKTSDLGILSFKQGAFKIIETLLAYGADPNQPDGQGRTALHITAIVNKSDVIQLLVLKGADPNIRDNLNHFASHYTKDSRVRGLILNALQPAQSTKEPISSLFSVSTSQEKMSQAKEKQYKVSLCKFFKVGKPDSCNRGNQCKFAHSAAELKM